MNRFFSIVSALLLSVVTLAVFGLLQDHGPESALRKFHVAAVNRDQKGLLDVIDVNTDPNFVMQLQQNVYTVARMGGRYEMRQIMRGQGTAIALVIYSIPRRNQEIAQMWALKRERGKWRIDADATRQHMFAFQGPDGAGPENGADVPQ